MNMISENKDPVNPACRAVALAKAGDPVEELTIGLLAWFPRQGVKRSVAKSAGVA